MSSDCDLNNRSDHVWAISLDAPTSDDIEHDEVDDAKTNTRDMLDNTLSPYNVVELQSLCPNCSVFFDYFRDGILLLNDAKARKVVYQAERFVLQDEILYHLDLPRQPKKSAGELVFLQSIVPQSLRELLLRFYHKNFRHLRKEKMYNTIRQKFYWLISYTDVHNWIKTCSECQMRKGGVTYKAPLKPFTFSALIFDTWHVVHICLPASKGFKYALVLVNSLSLYSLLLPAKTASAEETARL